MMSTHKKAEEDKYWYNKPYSNEKLPPLPEWCDPNLKIDRDAYLFLGDRHERSVTSLGRIWLRATCTLFGLGGVFLGNMAWRKPLWSGLQRYALAGIVGFGIGNYLQNLKDRYQADKDFMYFHYISLHPEDFPPKERVKYRDYLTHWQPIR